MTHPHLGTNRIFQRSASVLAAASFLGFALAGCNGGGSDGGTTFFTPFSTQQAVAGTTPVVISERWLAFLAEEAGTGAGGTDMNGDTDTNDSIATLVNMATKDETRLNVSADELVIVGVHLYLVTDEAKDGRDWDNDASTNDLVLLHTPTNGAAITFPTSYVATLESDGNVHALAVDGRLYYAVDDSVALANGDTSLRYIDPAVAATTQNTVFQSDLLNTLHPRILGSDEDLIFLTQDENEEGRNLNGTLGVPLDADSTDEFVLALLDGTDPAAVVQNVGLALEDDDPVFRAKARAVGDWLVGFLVDETAQGGQNLNDPLLFSGLWQPTQCATFEDADTVDQVLHFLEFALWTTNATLNPARDTGLVGHDRVLAVSATGSPGFVATISRESDEGTCNLNASGTDTDTTDDVLRWVEAKTPILPFTSAANLVALEDVPGGTHGATDIANKFVIVVDESDDGRDHDGLLANNDLAAWLTPSLGNSAVWVYDHNPATIGVQPSYVDWMAERKQRDRVLASFEEKSLVPPISINSGGDTDTLDSVPTFARFDPTNPADFDFEGPRIACDADNAGIAIGNGVAFYRVDEAADNRDWNGDSVKDDFVLFRTTVATLQNSVFLGTLNSLQRAAVDTTGNVGAAFIADEVMAGVDLNSDGDMNDLVVRWMRIGP